MARTARRARATTRSAIQRRKQRETREMSAENLKRRPEGETIEPAAFAERYQRQTKG